MGKDKNKEQDGESAFHREHHQPLGCLPHQQGPQLGERSTGHCPSQDNRQSSSKRDGKGS